MAAPLKLKREKVGQPQVAKDRPFLSVLVNTGIFHLDGQYDYLLPAHLDIEAGQWVSVPFKGANKVGLVVKRSEKSQINKPLFVNKSVRGPQLTDSWINFYQRIAERWATPIFDILRFVNKFQVSDQSVNQETNLLKGKREYLQLKPEIDEITQVRQIANTFAKTGRTLVIVPEERIAALLAEENFEVGMRSAVLKPSIYSFILTLREESEHHYEVRSPGFNTRDVALMRNQVFKENLIFLGFSPSLEMTKLIDSNYVALRKNRSRLSVLAKPSLLGELIPSALHTNLRKSLSKGAVLVIAPKKGYGLAISCMKCRNIAKCACGGRLTKRSKTSEPSCSICNKSVINWHCAHCGEHRVYLIGKGIDRIAEEFGKSFRNTKIYIATADKPVTGPFGSNSIILATTGAAPIQLYSSVVFLEGLNLAADLRSEERSLSTFFRYASFSAGNVLIVERPESRMVSALIQWNPFSYLENILSELKSANLPPTSRHILLNCATEEAGRIYSGILSAIRDGRLPSSVRCYDLGAGNISIFFPLKNADNTLRFFYEFQKRRSMAGKPLIKLRVDPYLLG